MELPSLRHYTQVSKIAPHQSLTKRWIPLFGLFITCVHGSAVDVQDIVRRASSAMQADWAAAPGFAFVQRDVTTSKETTTRKIHQVFMISGSDYYMPIATDDTPFPAGQQKLELQKLANEVARRNRETPAEALQRSEQYRKTREQNRILLDEFTKAFDFTFAGEETMNGHTCYLLDARPLVGYKPPNRTAKILTGMQGRLWIDKESFHWVKAEAQAVKPVSVFGFFAKVLPGTKMELEMIPVTDSTWLVSRFLVDVRLSILWRKSTKATGSTFSDYRPAAAALAEALVNEK
ncbi:MAG: hypothetical protein ACLPWF_09005 [Bryobacteraceae bacterium]